LYQYLNRCNSEQGKKLLATHSLNPLSKKEILLQQNAVKELKDKSDWLQQFQSFGIVNSITENTEKRIIDWLQQKQSAFHSKYWKWL
jgi:DNA mismatch repair ATPase MutS